jgi:hypothetical protein
VKRGRESSESEFEYNSPVKKSKGEPTQKALKLEDKRGELPTKVNKKRKGPEGTQDGILEKLSRLFEKSQQGCAAVCFVNNKILITDNEISQKTRGEGKETKVKSVSRKEKKTIGKYLLIKNTMDYFSKTLGDKKPSSEERNKVFQDICMHRISSQGKVPGMEYIRPNEGKFIKLVQDAFERYEELRTKYKENPPEEYKKLRDKYKESKKGLDKNSEKYEELRKEYIKTRRDYILGKVLDAIGKKEVVGINHTTLTFVCEHVIDLAWDFIKIEEFLADPGNQKTPLKLAFEHGAVKDGKGHIIEVKTDSKYYGLNRDGYMLMQEYNKETGYVILKMDIPTKSSEGTKSPHAEVKMIEYLLFTGILDGKKDIYIGISKVCCYDCELTIMAVNNVLKKKGGGQILYKGTHSMEFKYTPPFLLSDTKKTFEKFKEPTCYQLQKGDKYKPVIKNFAPEGVRDKTTWQNLYVTFDPDIIGRIQAEREKLESQYKPRVGEEMQYRSFSTSIEESSVEDHFNKERVREARKNAYNQRSNSEYLYQESDLSIIGKKLVEDTNEKQAEGDINAKFIGVVGKENVAAQLGEHNGLTNGEKILGIYNAGENQWVVFCIEKTKRGIELYYMDPTHSIDVRSFANAIKKALGVEQLRLNSTAEFNDLVTEADYGILALQSLEAFADSKDIPGLSSDPKDYRKNISDLRQSFANNYAQQVFNNTIEEVERAYTIWKELRDKSELVQNLKDIVGKEGSIGEKQGDLETFIAGTEEPSKEEKDLLSILTIKDDTKLKPNALALLGELIEMEELEKQGKPSYNTPSGGRVGGKHGDISSFTDTELLAEYEKRFKNKRPSEVGSGLEKAMQEANARGDDRSLIIHGSNRQYWYSIGDGFRLLAAIRKKKLQYSNKVKLGEEYTAHRENESGIFITDPYYLNSFDVYLEDDIKKLTGTHEIQEANHRWQAPPKVIIIPVLTGIHWRCIRVEMNYMDRKINVLFDDPYGANRFESVVKEVIQSSLLKHLGILIGQYVGDNEFKLPQDSMVEGIKTIDQQGAGNSYDCGAIVFSNVEGYADLDGTNQAFAEGKGYRISEAKEVGHDELIIAVRTGHIKEYAEIEGSKIDQGRLEDIRRRMGEENDKRLKEKQADSSVLEQISSLLPEYVDMIFHAVEELGLSVEDAYEAIMAEGLRGEKVDEQTKGKQEVEATAQQAQGGSTQTVQEPNKQAHGANMPRISGEEQAKLAEQKRVHDQFISYVIKGEEIVEINDLLESGKIQEYTAKEALKAINNEIIIGMILANFSGLKKTAEGMEIEEQGDGGTNFDSDHLKLVEKSHLVEGLEIKSVDGKAQYDLHQHLREVNPERKGFTQELANLNESAQEQRDKDFAQSTKRLYMQLVTGNKGFVTVLPENNHLIDHNANALALLEKIESGKIPPNTVIALERKQYGANLGMKDVIKLASIISHNEKHPTDKIAIPKAVVNSLIYQDAMLYKAAQARGIIVIGIEGKNLGTHKGSQEYDSIREKHMVKVLEQVTKTGRNVILSVGKDHVESLKASMGREGMQSEVVENVRDINFADGARLDKNTVSNVSRG